MTAFGALFFQYLQRSGLSNVRFALAVGLSDTTVGNVIRGTHVPRLKHAPQWIQALDLSEAEAREFVLEWQLAQSPPAIRELVASLRKQVDRRRRR